MINFNDEVLKEKLIKLALLQYKKEYKHGGHGPDIFDCAGLIWYLYNTIYDIDVYQDGYGMSTTTRIMTSSVGLLATEDILTSLELGDIIFFHRQSMQATGPAPDNHYPGHCGIYLGEHNFIHASRPKGQVVISNFDKNDYWQRVLVGRKTI